MKLSAPKEITYFIALILAILGVLTSQGIIFAYSGYAFGLVIAGFILLALGNIVKGL
jgi:hypothetical protein